jgi:hypothetical protein
MTCGRLLSRLKLTLGVVGLIIGAQPALAQAYNPYYNYYCPPGYALRVGYGCMPLSYFYGPPTYVYPGFGFNYFYGFNISRSFHHHTGRSVHRGTARHPSHGAHPDRH